MVGLAILTTVGYGDVTAITATDRVMGGFATIIGVGMFALLAARIAGLAGMLGPRTARPARWWCARASMPTVCISWSTAPWRLSLFPSR